MKRVLPLLASGDPAEIRGCASATTGVARNLRSQCEALEQAAGQLRQAWSGGAADGVQARLVALQGQLGQVARAIERVGEQLAGAATRIEAEQRHLQRRVGVVGPVVDALTASRSGRLTGARLGLAETAGLLRHVAVAQRDLDGVGDRLHRIRVDELEG